MSIARRLAVAAVACALFAVTAASASTIPVASAALGASDTATGTCDPDGVSVAYTTSFDTTVADYRTTTVTVGGIATACNGRTMSIAITAATGSALWQSTFTVTSTTMALTPAAPLQSSAIAAWAVSITG